MSKQFVKISKEFGFQRARLVYWEFFKEENKESVDLCFEGGIVVVLEGPDVQTFRNWAENEGEPAPETYQYTLFERQQIAQDQKEISASQGGK